ncbi:unnamed protein product [Penicillium salamii]|uniref:Uncharacterized protein n=1 Tax=Penicillium salamii TaxID=1612424 RepID=A0A9W4P072_9EURO|nr:unnamed protein product [Penicillium salamii]CAG8073015.1 unnamed protein product [Penicillium salamii]CAG8227869.1 unnamed protein product [Penicillium salamii]CAG8248634.1 unnamed protein product [Penicillium salamii]CAG8306271.1 unnamed protein product [Penicillium salamii]
MAANQSARQQKRSRPSDAAEKPARSNDERSKKRRVSGANENQSPQATKQSKAVTVSSGDVQADAEAKQKAPAPWSFSRPIGGRYTNLDPILTEDETSLLVGLDTAVQVIATSTSRITRTIQLEAGQTIVGLSVCPQDHENLYVFTLAGSISKWNWTTGKRIARWETTSKTIATSLVSIGKEESKTTLCFSINSSKGGKRQISVSPLGDEKIQGTTILETSQRLSFIKVTGNGRVVLASDGSHVFLGTTKGTELQTLQNVQYNWREVVLPVQAASFDIQGSDSIDLAVGATTGPILVYQNIVDTLFGKDSGDKKIAPRKLHWHRDACNTLRWSKDGNYIISGGNESVMVLWQLDTGRKNFLPHLSSPICNIVVSSSGSAYVVKLADNSIMVLSTRELQPIASITGLQLSPDAGASVGSSNGSIVAKLHPQQPERLIVSVPASHQFTQNQHSSQPANAAVLQTYDIRSNSSISRQALARTNATTLNMGPEGTHVIAPDVKHLDIVHDAKWLATVDSWAPHTQDVEALDRKAAATHQEVFLKFWKWDASSDTWELVTRVDGPHFSANHHSTVLGLASRPGVHEFATLGADSTLRFWCPTVKHRSGLRAKDQPEQPLNTWKCRGIVDLKGCLDTAQDSPLKSACMSFSEDGSVLAVCLPATSAANDGLVLLVNARDSTVHYRRTGVFLGNPCSTSFLGGQLIIASTHSVVAWNTVDDVVRTIQSSDSVDSQGTGNTMIAVNARTNSLAITYATANKKKNKARFEIKIYDASTFEVVFQEALKSAPVSLLADAYSGDYVVLDTAATVQRLGCLDKASQKSQNNQSRDVTGQIDSGLSTLFSRTEKPAQAQIEDVADFSAQTKGLAGVFGETPSFSLPAIGVLFRNVVQTLGAN